DLEDRSRACAPVPMSCAAAKPQSKIDRALMHARNRSGNNAVWCNSQVLVVADGGIRLRGLPPPSGLVQDFYANLPARRPGELSYRNRRTKTCNFGRKCYIENSSSRRVYPAG